jgi:hypothetical protein
MDRIALFFFLCFFSLSVPLCAQEEYAAEKGQIPLPTHSPLYWQLLPKSLLYPSYLASPNESRFAGVWNYDKDRDWMWDISLGGRAGLLRYGTDDKHGLPEGFQFDIEGNAHLRLDIEHERDVDAVDFRFGAPLTYRSGNWQFRTGYYHVSSHLGDERMLRLPEEHRVNYVREAWILSCAYNVYPYGKLYAEADYSFWLGEKTRPWHFLFGAEITPKFKSSWKGSPFAAVNVMLLQEHNYDGNITAQLGWQWGEAGWGKPAFRIGVQYFGGVSEQYEHIHRFREHKIGLGIWYDF